MEQESGEDIYAKFDSAEQKYLEQEIKVQNACTPWGRKIAGMRLTRQSRVIERLVEQADTHEFLAIKQQQMINGRIPIER